MNWKQAFTFGLLAPGVWEGQVAEEWETLFEGTVETEQTESSTMVNGVFVPYNGGWYWLETTAEALLNAEDTVRITIDGSVVWDGSMTQRDDASSLNLYAGNQWLAEVQGYEEVEDTGEDFLLRHYGPILRKYYTNIVTRGPGTYTIKIEKKVN